MSHNDLGLTRQRDGLGLVGGDQGLVAVVARDLAQMGGLFFGKGVLDQDLHAFLRRLSRKVGQNTVDAVGERILEPGTEAGDDLGGGIGTQSGRVGGAVAVAQAVECAAGE